jgi:apolipoprotein N-acyltransferase
MVARRIYAAVLIGILLRFVLGLHPVAWLVWFAPLPLLVLAFRSTAREARWLTALAAMIGLSTNFHYFHLMMPLPVVLLVLCLQTLLWMFVIVATRRVVLHYQAWWTVFAYPALWVAIDTLAAHLLPDGNWGSLAYSQAEFLPILQVTSLFGVAGLLFLVALLPSTLALAFSYGTKIPHVWRAYAATALLLGAALGYGALRLTAPVAGTPVTFGMAAIDDAIGPKATPAYIAGIWQVYDQQVARLAAQGAEVIVLPEKIGLITPAQAAEWQQHVSALAAGQHVWIEAGVGVDDGGKRTNLAWLFTPQGKLDATYQKHHMAPPEREYIAEHEYDVRSIGGNTYGLAICKDMHFAELGRAYGERKAAVMLIPAWDFYFDRWLAARTTLMRGVENGYTVVRASREGLLTVSDPYGRVLGERESSTLPGSTLLVTAKVAAPLATLYTRIGDLFGWFCVAASAVLLTVGRSATARARITLKDNRSEARV